LLVDYACQSKHKTKECISTTEQEIYTYSGHVSYGITFCKSKIIMRAKRNNHSATHKKAERS
jgi:hypothetical protein